MNLYFRLNCSFVAVALLKIHCSLKEPTCSVHLLAIGKIYVLEEVDVLMVTRPFASD